MTKVRWGGLEVRTDLMLLPHPPFNPPFIEGGVCRIILKDVAKDGLHE